jgi:nucleotide-binding universal stress UspA family protein
VRVKDHATEILLEFMTFEPLITAVDPVVTAVRRRPDLFVMGSRGLGGVRGMLMGSVSLKVSHFAPCSVTIVK